MTDPTRLLCSSKLSVSLERRALSADNYLGIFRILVCRSMIWLLTRGSSLFSIEDSRWWLLHLILFYAPEKRLLLNSQMKKGKYLADGR